MKEVFCIMDDGIRILVVDDELSIRGILTNLLREDGYDVTAASSGEEALELFTKGHYQLVITDIVMGNMNGIELLQKVKGINSDTQVVIMTSYASLDTTITALRSGAYDYLIKPFEDLNLISALINRALEKVKLITENRSLLEDLKQKNEALEKANMALQSLAIQDGLTGVYNHRYFQEALFTEIVRSQRNNHTFSLIFMDVDHFKTYNDTHGHVEGDNVLRTLAELFKKHVRRSDIVARYGGEEFVIILPETPKEKGYIVAENLRKLVEEYPFKGKERQPLGMVTLSMGCANFSEDGTDAATLIRYADKALYKAKNSGRNVVF